jgi:hypothetical protein
MLGCFVVEPLWQSQRWFDDLFVRIVLPAADETNAAGANESNFGRSKKSLAEAAGNPWRHDESERRVQLI